MDADRLIRKQRARAWFNLRDRTSPRRGLEDALPRTRRGTVPPPTSRAPWNRTATQRRRAGRRHGMMKGRVFEKVGVHASAVLASSRRNSARIPGAPTTRAYANGVSVIAHLHNRTCRRA
jgi:coproporphyrinogen III oxidase